MTDEGPALGRGRAGPAAWMYVAASVGLAVVIAVVFDLSIWTGVLISLLVVCPVLIVWTYFFGQRPLPVPLGPAPQTRGDTLLFDWIAPWYDSIWCPAFGLGGRFRDRVEEIAAFKPGEHVLDVGCGTGWLTRRAANSVGPSGSAWGIDPAPDMVRVAMQCAGCARNPAHFKLAAVETLPFEGGRFDVAVVSLVLHHLPPDVKAMGLKEVHRVLKAGARLIVVDFDRPDHWLSRALLWPLNLHPNLRDLEQGRVPDMLRKAGFTSVDNVSRWAHWISFWSARKPA